MLIQSVTVGVTEHLRNLIMTGDLEAGSKLNEIDISSRLGISRPPLREAFRKLENEHLVIARPRRGVFVAEMSKRDCEHVYEVLQMLECETLSLLMRHNARIIPGIEEIFVASENQDLPKNNDPKEIIQYFEVTSLFHKKLMEVANNAWILHFHDNLRPTLTRYQIWHLKLTGDHRALHSEHRSIYKEITKGCYEEARKILINHIISAKCRLQEHL